MSNSNWKKNLKKGIRKIAPPILVDLYVNRKMGHSLVGGFPSWEEADKNATGYDSDSIFERAKKAALAVKNGAAVYERDTVLFFQPSYSNSVLAGLLRSLIKNQHQIKLLDFGGALGSTYFNFLSLIRDVGLLTWGVIEQPHFVKFGKENLETKQLRFFESIDDFNNEVGVANTILISGSLQFIRDYQKILDPILEMKPSIVIIDRLPFMRDRNASTKVFIQKVSEQIYPASYTCWAFNKTEILSQFSHNYNVVLETVCHEVAHKEVEYLGIVLERK